MIYQWRTWGTSPWPLLHGMHYLLTWDCAHVANAAVRNRIRLACEELHFECPIICTPEMLMEG